MDIFERFNNKFGKWYEGFFGVERGELRPRDVLRKITVAMEDNRKEGFDSKVYVPNKYILELALNDPEERDYLLSFLDEEELTTVLKRFMAENGYHTRGPLDFTIQEVDPVTDGIEMEKLRVKVRFEKGQTPSRAPNTDPAELESSLTNVEDDDMPTVAATFEYDEDATVSAVSWGALLILGPDSRKRHFSITSPSISIGRSRHAGNDLVLDGDGMVSKVHARVEREPDGEFSVYDSGSTNGVLLNGNRLVGNAILKDGDVITIGGTTLTFQAAANPKVETLPVRQGGLRRARITVLRTQQIFVLASETVIGRSVTSDIVLEDPSVSMKQARIVSPDPSLYYLEDLGNGATKVNDRELTAMERIVLADGDVIIAGKSELVFQAVRE